MTIPDDQWPEVAASIANSKKQSAARQEAKQREFDKLKKDGKVLDVKAAQARAMAPGPGLHGGHSVELLVNDEDPNRI